MKKADLILLASDSGFTDIDQNQEVQAILKEKPHIKIATKKDINKNQKEADIAICSKTDDLGPLIALMKKKLNIEQKEESEFLGKREEEYLISIRNQIQKAHQALLDTGLIDITSDTLREAISLINDLMGNSKAETMEDIYATLFSKFCLGK
jgi:tRNA U34 5-carboxymethylaminomethyl modifying GTPase MnmE/TrmE